MFCGFHVRGTYRSEIASILTIGQGALPGMNEEPFHTASLHLAGFELHFFCRAEKRIGCTKIVWMNGNKNRQKAIKR
jgi:hypothetical protein